MVKGEVKSVLRIGSAHNKGGPADINIAQISHLSNFSDIKLWLTFIYEHSKPEQFEFVYINKEFVYITKLNKLASS